MNGTLYDGGPAFPGAKDEERLRANEGMTLRDYFAAHEWSEPRASWIASVYGLSIKELKGAQYSEMLAKWRYQVADAMLAQRAEGGRS